MISPRHIEAPVIRPAFHAARTHRASAKPIKAQITEVITRDNNLTNMPLLMPLLAQLSQDDRWLVWVAPPSELPKTLLVDAGIDLNKVIMLHPDDHHSAHELSCRALRTGTSHVVTNWHGTMSDDELHELESASRNGASQGIIIRHRQHA